MSDEEWKQFLARLYGGGASGVLPNATQTAGVMDGVGMGEGYYTGDGHACSQHCMLSILYCQEAYYWSTWHDEAQQNIKDGEPVYDAEGNAYYLTEQFEEGNVHLNEPSFEGGHDHDYY